MKHLILVILGLVISLHHLNAQDDDYLPTTPDEEEASFKDDLFIDGNFALQFGSQTLIGGNPQLGYHLSDRVALGVGYSYFLSSFRIPNGPRINDKLHGPTAFGRVLISDAIFARTDFQYLTYVFDNLTDAEPETFNRNRWFLGGGYRAPISKRSFANVGVYLDLLDPVAQPLIRGGVAFGF